MPNIGFWAVAGASAAADVGSFDLLATTLISTNTASVTFDVSTYAALGYKHLQVRITAKSDSAGDANGFAVNARFNGDGASNYAHHQLDTNQSDGIRSVAFTGTNSLRSFVADNNSFGGGVMEIVDAFSSTKFKTTRSFGGNASTNSGYRYIGIYSGLWRNTNALTSITFISSSGSNFVSGCRFSIYGVK